MRPFFDLNEPNSATPKEWRLWKARMKRERPIAWFLRKTLWDDGIAFAWSEWISRPIADACRAIKYRVIPRHQYHILRTGLTPGYHDADERLLYACFALLVECVERQPQRADWGMDQQRRKVWEEIAVLYEWWQKTRPARSLPEIHELPEDMAYPGALFDEDNRGRPEMIRWKQEADMQSQIESRWAEEDEVMLGRLIAVRRYLWT